MRGKSFVNVIDPEDRAVVNQLVSTISARQPVIQHEHKVYRLNSEKRWMRWIHRGIFDREGELIEIQSVGFDVTDYRSLADQSKQKEAIFAGVYDNTTDFISIYKIVGQDIILESLNHSAEQALGTLGNQLVGRKLQDFFALNESSETIAKYWNAVRERKSQVFEEEVLISGVVRHFLTTIVPIPNANGEIDKLAAISRDVSTYKRIELDLRQAKESADIASRAKSDFLASMSHELRTPLNVVLGFCQMLELSRLDSEQLNYVNGIHRSGQLLLTLIEDILDISKIEAGKIKLESIPFSMPDLISSAAELFTSQAAEKGIKLHWEVSENAATNVMGDPNRLRQVLVNFIGNSIKFTSKGSIEITVEARGTQNSAERMFRISVKDTGIGIREQDKEKIFQKFSQAETGHARRFGGSGLGLAICKNLVGVMGGRVGFDSEFNRGSTFWFEVPLMLTGELPMTNLHQKISTTNQVSSRRLHVLIVDDNLDSRTVAELFLKRLGHTYTSVETGHLAINELSKNTFDLVLMDMQMPEMDGCETTVRIRNGVSKDIPIIALTANALMEDVDRCFAAGMNDYISKPVRLDELSAMLNKWSVKVTADNLIDGK
jgi:PAS domain S-box-containing protein